jgi:hypothetical protein
MPTWIWILALVTLIGGPCVGVWWWLVRVPADRGEVVSSAWLDEHIRGRRD